MWNRSNSQRRFATDRAKNGGNSRREKKWNRILHEDQKIFLLFGIRFRIQRDSAEAKPSRDAYFLSALTVVALL